MRQRSATRHDACASMARCRVLHGTISRASTARSRGFHGTMSRASTARCRVLRRHVSCASTTCATRARAPRRLACDVAHETAPTCWCRTSPIARSYRASNSSRESVPAAPRCPWPPWADAWRPSICWARISRAAWPGPLRRSAGASYPRSTAPSRHLTKSRRPPSHWSPETARFGSQRFHPTTLPCSAVHLHGPVPEVPART